MWRRITTFRSNLLPCFIPLKWEAAGSFKTHVHTCTLHGVTSQSTLTASTVSQYVWRCVCAVTSMCFKLCWNTRRKMRPNLTSFLLVPPCMILWPSSTWLRYSVDTRCWRYLIFSLPVIFSSHAILLPSGCGRPCLVYSHCLDAVAVTLPPTVTYLSEPFKYRFSAEVSWTIVSRSEALTRVMLTKLW